MRDLILGFILGLLFGLLLPPIDLTPHAEAGDQLVIEEFPNE